MNLLEAETKASEVKSEASLSFKHRHTILRLWAFTHTHTLCTCIWSRIVHTNIFKHMSEVTQLKVAPSAVILASQIDKGD